ncbi:hypothetical protein HDV05_003466 [Chytridiales sp. JEL 0842]|nr:hypothetical protein HDV05_003466 [Chytridiales sp. JEL 0842]
MTSENLLLVVVPGDDPIELHHLSPPDSDTTTTQDPSDDPPLYTLLASISTLSILGTLLRISLLYLTTYPSAPVFPLIYPQILGCLLMGFFATFFPSKTSYEALGVGLRTGLCGSLTTFSSFAVLAFKSLSGYELLETTGGLGVFLGPKREGGGGGGVNIFSGVSVVGITLGASASAYLFGVEVAKTFKMGESLRNNKNRNSSSSSSVFNRATLLSTLVIYSIPLILLIVSSTSPSNFPAFLPSTSLACLLSSPGSLLRWWLSKKLNSPSFPWGTLAANLTGTAVLAFLNVVPLLVEPSAGGWWVIVGLADGFCGCLTTLSTFVVEMIGLKLRRGTVYATVSIAAGLVLVAVVVLPAVLTR